VDGATPAVAPCSDVAGGTVVVLPEGTHVVEMRPRGLAASNAWWLSAAIALVLIWMRLRRIA